MNILSSKNFERQKFMQEKLNDVILEYENECFSAIFILKENCYSLSLGQIF